MLYKSHNQDKVKKGVPWAPGKNSEVSHERNANAGGEQIQIKTATHLEANMSHSQMLGRFEYGGGPIFKVILEC